MLCNSAWPRMPLTRNKNFIAALITTPATQPLGARAAGPQGGHHYRVNYNNSWPRVATGFVGLVFCLKLDPWRIGVYCARTLNLSGVLVVPA